MGLSIYLSYPEADALRKELVSGRVATPMKQALWERLMGLKLLAMKRKKPTSAPVTSD